MSKSRILFVGLMLFSMFFGAGNLIFPPFLGANAGTNFPLAITGFVVTAVGLPLLVLTALSFVEGGARTLASRVHPIFGLVFTIIVYLSIGPFLGIPRNATLAYEMGLKPFIPDSSFALFGFTALFFLLVFLVSLNQSKMVDLMGKIITPLLLLSMVVLVVTGFVQLKSGALNPTTPAYVQSPFLKGFLEGYNTMDALAALAFGIVILTTLKRQGVSEGKMMRREMLKAGLLAGVLLAIVYCSLGYIGVKMAGMGSFENGSVLLSSASFLLFGRWGNLLLGIIFVLACFTTCVGLVSACGNYFHSLLPKVSYKKIALFFVLISFGFANFGLDTILSMSVPFLVATYSLTIVLVVLSFFHPLFGGSSYVYIGAMTLTGIVALYDGLKAFGFTFGIVDSYMSYLPFADLGLGWVILSFVGTAIGYGLYLIKRNSVIAATKHSLEK
ncbi:branched-chain amino acid transport system II carrier protein [Psychrobacillus vulpis]|uniref:Branched-chain amino acid transport system carrier protein n=1 Tax=Psychrobacillus vulpis TaxID=2325572 RepID=A0A544TML5_9BACI|nr:branched-chain amino acid transport system II carrier protein [Psychrobacillus vulpis]TQR18702.1 branched-chain amino acid transport system II carrier protein [Psychrobacillus vulpis]